MEKKRKVKENPFQILDQKAIKPLQRTMNESQFLVLTNKIKLSHKKVLRPINKDKKDNLNLHQVTNKVIQRKHLTNLPNQRINQATTIK